ncbi:MAG: hypothetical protein MI747_03985 [Desulfobacterales bacterium]|nr:hypothetical protein [Desulfobacterales bacterium]
MIYRLKQVYMTGIIPAVILAGGIETARFMGVLPRGMAPAPEWVARGSFILAALTALAGPVLIRALFAHFHGGSTQVAPGPFFRFQLGLLLIPMVTPYLACAALALEFPRFYGGGIVLMALYAVYYYYPSEQRINFDKRIFRVGDNGSE